MSRLSLNGSSWVLSSDVSDDLRSLGDLNGGGYTFTDTAAVALSSYSYNSGTDTHTFNLNTIAVGNETYSLISGANFTSPKWRAPLTYADGSSVLMGDAFTFSVKFDNVSVGASRQYLIAVAVIQSASSTVTGTMRPSGLYCLTTSVGTTGGGVIADNVAAAATAASMTSGNGSVVFSGGSTMYKGGGAIALVGGAGSPTTVRADGNAWSGTTTTPLALGVFVSSNGSVATTGGQFDVRIKYKVTKMS